MIQEIVGRFTEVKPQLREKLREAHPRNYRALVQMLVQVLDGEMDPDRVEQIDHGDYQGTLLFVIAATGYQPSTYWTVKVDYGSCSGCDTLQAICDYIDEQPNEKQLDEYMTLALHIVQGLKEA